MARHACEEGARREKERSLVTWPALQRQGGSPLTTRAEPWRGSVRGEVRVYACMLCGFFFLFVVERFLVERVALFFFLRCLVAFSLFFCLLLFA